MTLCRSIGYLFNTYESHVIDDVFFKYLLVDSSKMTRLNVEQSKID